MTTQSIAIDAMGGDVGPRVTIPASLDALKKYPNLRIILVGDQIQIESLLKKYDEISQRWRCKSMCQCWKYWSFNGNSKVCVKNFTRNRPARYSFKFT